MSEENIAAESEAGFAEEPSDSQKLAMLQEAIMSCEQNMAVLQEQRDSYLDQLKRAQAEFQNYKKRASREQAQIEQRVARKFLEELLPVLDNLDYTVSSLDENSEIFKPILMIKESFCKVLSERGVTAIDPVVGDPFDPEIHSAISVMPSDVDHQQVGHIVRRGYAIGDQVFRPSDIVVLTPKT